MPAKSEKQRVAAAIALSAKRGDTPKSELKGASKQMAEGMNQHQLHDFAKKSASRTLFDAYRPVVKQAGGLGPALARMATRGAASAMPREAVAARKLLPGAGAKAIPTGKPPLETGRVVGPKALPPTGTDPKRALQLAGGGALATLAARQATAPASPEGSLSDRIWKWLSDSAMGQRTAQTNAAIAAAGK